MGRYRIAVDIGGTFTDFVFYDSVTAKYKTGKTLTTPENLSNAIVNGLDKEIENYSEIDFFVHGTTAGINAFLERKGSRVALITTKGFRDVYEIARGDRQDMYDRFYKKPLPLVERKDIFEIDERILFDGSIDKSLDVSSVHKVAEEIKNGGYKAVAVVLLNAYINPEHEIQVEEILKKELQDKTISISHKIAREWREYERTSTVVLNSYIAPIVENYLGLLENRMQEKNYKDTIYIMQSSGGIMTSTVAKDNPILTLLSGPVGGAIGKNFIYETLGYKNLIGIDMGGTSFDVSMLIDGKPDVSAETYLEGFPILTPMVNIYTIGAGGGSIAWLEGGGLRVGPISAGSNPGPACYGKGGTEPTVTDANLVLGRIDPEGFLDGDMVLDKKASIKAIAKIGDKLNMNANETAEGICSIANASMADVIRQITVRKGIDPKDFAFVAFGGAGPMHAVFIAEELGIDTIIVPNMPGTYSAWGMHQCDIRQDAVRTYRNAIESISINEVNKLYDEMEKEIFDVLSKQNIKKEQIEYIKTADMRYLGQDYTLSIEFSADKMDETTIQLLKDAYHNYHYQVYGHNNPNDNIEIVNIRLVGIGKLKRVKAQDFPVASTEEPKPYKINQVIFSGKEFSTNIYKRSELEFGQEIDGPAVIEELSSTSVIPPGYKVNVDKYYNLVVKKI